MSRIYLIALLFFSQSVIAQVTEKYIAQYAPLAKEQMKKYGVPASITLAQGILESGNGNSELAKKANNHLGLNVTTLGRVNACILMMMKKTSVFGNTPM